MTRKMNSQPLSLIFGTTGLSSRGTSSTWSRPAFSGISSPQETLSNASKSRRSRRSLRKGYGWLRKSARQQRGRRIRRNSGNSQKIKKRRRRNCIKCSKLKWKRRRTCSEKKRYSSNRRSRAKLLIRILLALEGILNLLTMWKKGQQRLIPY